MRESLHRHLPTSKVRLQLEWSHCRWYRLPKEKKNLDVQTQNWTVLRCSWVVPKTLCESQHAQLSSPHNSSSLTCPYKRLMADGSHVAVQRALLYLCSTPPGVPSVHPWQEPFTLVQKATPYCETLCWAWVHSRVTCSRVHSENGEVL